MMRQPSRYAIYLMLVVLWMAGCSGARPEPTATPAPSPPSATPIRPTSTPQRSSCEEIEGICLELSFDGESCTYEGPAALEK
jgi:hypothetical protein